MSTFGRSGVYIDCYGVFEGILIDFTVESSINIKIGVYM